MSTVELLNVIRPTCQANRILDKFLLIPTDQSKNVLFFYMKPAFPAKKTAFSENI
jgi:hypothetical protein